MLDACELLAKPIVKILTDPELLECSMDSRLVPIDQVQKFLGHVCLSTTQIYAETSLQALGDN